MDSGYLRTYCSGESDKTVFRVRQRMMFMRKIDFSMCDKESPSFCSPGLQPRPKLHVNVLLQRLPSGKPAVNFMPVSDFLFTEPPAEIYFLAIPQVWEID